MKMLESKLLKGVAVFDHVGITLVKKISYHPNESSSEEYFVEICVGDGAESNPEDSIESAMDGFSFEVSEQMYKFLVGRRRQQGTSGRIILDLSRGYTGFTYKRE